jgi:hypothetical protein
MKLFSLAEKHESLKFYNVAELFFLLLQQEPVQIPLHINSCQDFSAVFKLLKV